MMSEMIIQCINDNDDIIYSKSCDKSNVDLLT